MPRDHNGQALIVGRVQIDPWKEDLLSGLGARQDAEAVARSRASPCLGPQACAIAEPAIDVEVSEEDDNGVGFEGEGIGREAVWGEGEEEFGGIDE